MHDHSPFTVALKTIMGTCGTAITATAYQSFHTRMSSILWPSTPKTLRCLWPPVMTSRSKCGDPRTGSDSWISCQRTKTRKITEGVSLWGSLVVWGLGKTCLVLWNCSSQPFMIHAPQINICWLILVNSYRKQGGAVGYHAGRKKTWKVIEGVS